MDTQGNVQVKKSISKFLVDHKQLHKYTKLLLLLLLLFLCLHKASVVCWGWHALTYKSWLHLSSPNSTLNDMLVCWNQPWWESLHPGNWRVLHNMASSCNPRELVYLPARSYIRSSLCSNRWYLQLFDYMTHLNYPISLISSPRSTEQHKRIWSHTCASQLTINN